MMVLLKRASLDMLVGDMIAGTTLTLSEYGLQDFAKKLSIYEGIEIIATKLKTGHYLVELFEKDSE